MSRPPDHEAGGSLVSPLNFEAPDDTGLPDEMRQESDTQPDVSPLSPLTPAEIEQAAQWLLRLREPGTRPCYDQFERWLAESTRHPIAFARAERLFGALAAPATELEERERRRTGRSRLSGPRTRLPARWAALAASLAAAVAVGFAERDRLVDWRADAATRAGETEMLDLADGSRVTLNTHSALRYDLDASVRRVRLDRGEAFFDVARDESRPFYVETGAARVRVLGTHFNVRKLGDGAVVSVTGGRVQVASVEGGPPVVLTAGLEGGVLEGRAIRRADADVQKAVAWRKQQAVFYRASLTDVAAELGRYRDAPVVVMDRRAGRRTLSAVFDIGQPDAALATAAATVHAKIAELPGGTLLIY